MASQCKNPLSGRYMTFALRYRYVLLLTVKLVHNIEIRLITKIISIIVLTPSEPYFSYCN